MAGVAVLAADVVGLDLAQDALRRLAGFNVRPLLEAVGAEVESQTRRRIHTEKRGPDGIEWPEWSESYASHQHGVFKAHKPHPGQLRKAGGHSLLELTGNLLDSIQWEVRGDEVVVGSNMVYAPTHQYGTDDVPARPFLGLSKDNADDVEQVILDFIARGLK